ncbi:DUF1931 family protein [Jatrophihabitans sp. DSM 45814]
MAVAAANRVKELFRATSGLTIDASDVKRYRDFVYDKLYDLLLVAVASAKANNRDILQPCDLPLTKGLQERIHEFARLEQQISIETVMEELATHPPLDVATSEELEARLPAVIGGLSVALAQCFVIIAPHRKNPGTDQWNEAIALFNLLL